MGLKVLLADDSQAIKKTFEISLCDYGVNIKVSTDPVVLKRLAKEFVPDIIFIDFLALSKQAYETAKSIASHDQTKGIPIILLQSSFLEFKKEEIKQAGIVSVLEKPFQVKSLRETILKWVKKTQTQYLSEYVDFDPVSNWKIDSDHILDHQTPDKDKLEEIRRKRLKHFHNIDNDTKSDVQVRSIKVFTPTKPSSDSSSSSKASLDKTTSVIKQKKHSSPREAAREEGFSKDVGNLVSEIVKRDEIKQLITREIEEKIHEIAVEQIHKIVREITEKKMPSIAQRVTQSVARRHIEAEIKNILKGVDKGL